MVVDQPVEQNVNDGTDFYMFPKSKKQTTLIFMIALLPGLQALNHLHIILQFFLCLQGMIASLYLIHLQSI